MKENAISLFDDGALYRISINDEESIGCGALTASNFAIQDNSAIKIAPFESHLSQIWRVHKRDDETCSFENMASRMYMTLSCDNENNNYVSVCLDGTNDIAKRWIIYTHDGTISNCSIENVYSHNNLSVINCDADLSRLRIDGQGAWSFSFTKLSDGDEQYPYMLVLSGDINGAASCPEIIYHDGV